MRPFKDATVQAAFDTFPDDAREGLMMLREQIFACAEDSDAISPLTEALRWGQPSYLCLTGSTLRLGVPKMGGFAIYAHCQTSIISDFIRMFPRDFTVEANRAIHFSDVQEIDPEKLGFLISGALTYKT